MADASSILTGSTRVVQSVRSSSRAGVARGKVLEREALEVDSSFKGKLFNVQTVVAGLCLFGILVSTVSSATIITVESQDKALRETRDSSERATDACFATANSALEQVTSDLFQYSSSGISQILFNFLYTIVNEAARFETLILDVHRDANTSSFDWMYGLHEHFFISVKTLEKEGVALSGFGTGPDKFFMYYNIQGTFSLLLGDGVTPGSEAWTMDSKGAKDTYSYRLDLDASTVSGRILIRDSVHPVGTGRFGTIVPYGDYVGLMYTLFRRDIEGRDVMIYLSMTLPKVSRYLSALTSQIQDETGATVRLYTCVASLWVTEAYAALGDTHNAEATNQVGYLTGVSHGTATLSHYNSDGKYTHSTVRTDVEASDDLTASIARGINGSYADYTTGSQLVQVVNGTSNASEWHFVLVRRLQDAAIGIDWWLVNTIDAAYIYAEVVTERQEVEAAIASDKKKVEDDIENKMYLTIGIVAAVAVVLLLFSLSVAHYIAKPIKALVSDMNHVAEMDLDYNYQDSISTMYEVKAIQVSFLKMKKNLRDFRAFVPNALLNASGEFEHLEPPTGNVSIVFTDIVKSTELWERSANGMNTAMEMHNEAIREAIAEYNGYEVKTIGDAFMVAFYTPVDAIKFCLKVQSDFATMDWPADLDLEQGLKLRMGAHIGNTIPEENPLTARRDYRGPTVNMASRAEAKAYPGTVCLTSEMYLAVKSAHLGEVASESIGTHTMKGIDGVHKLMLMTPFRFSDRLKKSTAPTNRRTAYNVSHTQGSPMPKSMSPVSGRYRQSPHDTSSCVSAATGVNSGVELPPASNAPAQQKKTGLTLVRGQVTVAVCKLLDARNDCIFDNCNTMVRLVVEAASQTDGVVGSVTGRTMTIVWNTSKPCKLHTTAALRFAAQLERRSSKIMRIGVATGEMLYGNVGTQKKRFHTTFGRPLEAAEAAADHALHLGTFCLLADCTTDCKVSSNAAISPFVRLVDMWMDEETDRQIILLELMARKLVKQLEDAWGTVAGQDMELEIFNTNVRDAIAGSRDALANLEKALIMTPEDTSLHNLVQILAAGGPDYYNTHRVSVRFTTLPEGVLSSLNALKETVTRVTYY